MGRVNRAIELLEGRHTLIYGGSGDLSFEGGVSACQTDNDFSCLNRACPDKYTRCAGIHERVGGGRSNEKRAIRRRLYW